MPGKAGKSGPPGNLNSARYPWRTFWRRRALKPSDRWVIPLLEGYGQEIMVDKGGTDNMTAGERRMADIAQTARGASMLILAEAARSGFTTKVDGTWDLAPGVKELAKFLNTERQALDSLGLQRRVKVKTLAELLSEDSDAAGEGEEGGEQGDGGTEPEPKISRLA